MPNSLKSDYQLNYARYKHYYRQIWKFYQKPSIKISSALLLTVFTTIFFAVFAIRPTLVTVAELLKTIEDKDEVLAKLKKKAASLASAQEEYSLNAPTIDRLNQAIPTDKEVQELITLIEATAADHELVLDTVSLNEFEYRKNASLPDAVTLPISISMSADYVALKNFLHDVVRLPRFISVDSIAFAQPDDNESETEFGAIKLAIRFSSHYMPLQTRSTKD